MSTEATEKSLARAIDLASSMQLGQAPQILRTAGPPPYRWFLRIGDYYGSGDSLEDAAKWLEEDLDRGAKRRVEQIQATLKAKQAL